MQYKDSIRVFQAPLTMRRLKTARLQFGRKKKRKGDFRVVVNLRVMAMNGYSTLTWSPKLEPHYQMQINFIYRTLTNVAFNILPRIPHFRRWGSYPSTGDTISVFQAPLTKRRLTTLRLQFRDKIENKKEKEKEREIFGSKWTWE